MHITLIKKQHMHLEIDFFEQWYKINLKVKYFPYIQLYTNTVFRFSVIF